MRGQWGLILAFIFALIVAIFSVFNVRSVEVNYLFGQGHWPLILVILVSAVLGAIIVGFAGLFRIVRLQRDLKRAKKKIAHLETENPQPPAPPEEPEAEREEETPGLNEKTENKDGK